jgi:hypothetical protein
MILLGFKIGIGIILFLFIINLIVYLNKPKPTLILPQIQEDFTVLNEEQSSPSPSPASPASPSPSPSPSPFRFLNPTTTQVFTISNNNYLSSMNSTNMIARQITKDTSETKYCSSILTISDSEKKSFTNFIKLINDKLDVSADANAQRCKNFINYNLTQYTIIAKSSSWLENGMPHTHENIIFFPQKWFDEIGNTTTRTNLMRITDNGGTLAHEIIHIIQRLHPTKFEKLYERWGFIHTTYIDNFVNIEQLNRENPDGRDIKWIWKQPNSRPPKFYWFGAVFKTDSPSRLSDVEYLIYPIYEIDSKNKQFKLMENGGSKLELSACNEHNVFFGITNNHYHPNEIVAEYFAIWFKNMCGLNGGIQSDAYLIFESWLLSELL